jgi:hypothetical protein
MVMVTVMVTVLVTVTVMVLVFGPSLSWRVATPASSACV